MAPYYNIEILNSISKGVVNKERIVSIIGYLFTECQLLNYEGAQLKHNFFNIIYSKYDEISPRKEIVHTYTFTFFVATIRIKL